MRTVCADELHLQAVAHLVIAVVGVVEIRPGDHKGTVVTSSLECTRGRERVNECHAEATTWVEDSTCFVNCRFVVVDVLKRHEGNHAVERRILKGQLCGVRRQNLRSGIGTSRGLDHGGRGVDADHLMAETL